ncbi:MAG: glycine cleavage system protein H [Bacteroidota bacterium]
MDGYSYYNIFDTKGIEYLVIIAFLLLLIPFWLILNKQTTIRERIRKVVGVLKINMSRVPQGIFHSKNHTWAHLERSGIARIGLDDLLLHITGEVKVNYLKNPGEPIQKGDLLAEIDQDGRKLKVFSPVSGNIVKPNPELSLNHDLLYQDPYGKGWIYSIKPTHWVEEIASCFLAEEATGFLTNELVRYKDFLAHNASKYSPEASLAIMQDGGELAENSLSGLPDEFWQDFQKEFLNP